MRKRRAITRYVLVSSEDEAAKLSELTSDLWSEVYDPLDCKLILGFDCDMWAVRYYLHKEDFDVIIKGLGLKRYRKISDSRVWVYNSELNEEF